ncbi:uncharacterized protein B0I36DRAFT_326979 [Microdochium trichocladiopsis]|uniref:Uncharacterized protein n=1 Tax=Microdochium trichocladiopsis TaxID=1682393 RepID=A0A9P8Y1C4_9PEZI|nr:uncharacterized protein B0I36DRAFT_326979 [Microdochium trichocladiopsis]KAH7027375.1 hypothetical protein B0I36DRAFT_326979 [Microdochium trichocladiopsis]
MSTSTRLANDLLDNDPPLVSRRDSDQHHFWLPVLRRAQFVPHCPATLSVRQDFMMRVTRTTYAGVGQHGACHGACPYCTLFHAFGRVNTVGHLQSPRKAAQGAGRASSIWVLGRLIRLVSFSDHPNGSSRLFGPKSS